VLLFAVHEDARGARLPRLDARPERHRPVEDVPREDLLDLQVEVGRVRQLEGRKQGGDRAAVRADLQRDLGLDDHRAVVLDRPRPAVLQEAVARQEPGERRVDSEPLLGLAHVEADLPADRLGALRQDLAPPRQQRLGAALDAHGFITILSASRRS
jgi:hypothetical protein